VPFPSGEGFELSEEGEDTPQEPPLNLQLLAAENTIFVRQKMPIS